MTRQEIGPFPGHVKPVRVGVYKRNVMGSRSGYSMWTGWEWRHLRGTVQDAAGERVDSLFQSLPWYGLTKPEKA